MSNLYKVGGALPLNAPSYIRRQADHDLYEGLLAGEFCYVLNSRQMGKSSLRVQTMRRLQEAGIACAAIDITKVGSQGITSEEWYAGVLFTLINQLHLPLTLQQFEGWWEDHRLLSPVNRFSEFIDGVLLEEIAGRIAIFIDEIDSILQLNFKDDFFAAIRACYNKRAESPEYDRLTFALLGVATPSNLIQDKNRTPFNIGQAIQLNGFQLEEAQSLAQGLADKATNPEAVLQAILHWTGGQPFLTQKLCQLALAYGGLISEDEEANWTEQLVQTCVIENWESQDEPEHLRTIRDRLLNNKQQAGRLLDTYQRVLQQTRVQIDNSDEKNQLRLSGLVVNRNNSLQIYNKVYECVFDQAWVSQSLADLRPYGDSLQKWFASGKDTSWLLRGQALQDAQAWAENKSLSDQDHQFLTTSQNFQQQETQKALDAEKEARISAEQVNQILAETVKEAKEKAKKILSNADRQARLKLEFTSAAILLIFMVLVFGISTFDFSRHKFISIETGFNLKGIIDFTLFLIVFYIFLPWTVRNSRYTFIFRGLIILMMAAALTRRLDLALLSFVLSNLVIAACVGAALSLQTEIISLIEYLGKGQFLKFLHVPQKDLAKREGVAEKPQSNKNNFSKTGKRLLFVSVLLPITIKFLIAEFNLLVSGKDQTLANFSSFFLQDFRFLVDITLSLSFLILLYNQLNRRKRIFIIGFIALMMAAALTRRLELTLLSFVLGNLVIASAVSLAFVLRFDIVHFLGRLGQVNPISKVFGKSQKASRVDE